MLKFLNRTSAMILVPFVVLLISPTILKSNEKAETVPSSVSFSAEKKPTNVMVISVVAKKDDRSERLASFFAAKKSPFVPYSDDFVRIADKYDLDYTLLPAISGVESSFGLQVPAYSYNAYGWNNGLYRFKDWVDAAETVAQGIRTRYAQDGYVSPFRIGPRYAENPTWASRVSRYQAEIATY